MKKFILLLLAVFLILALTACNESSEQQPTLTGRFIAGVANTHILVVDDEHLGGVSPISMHNSSGIETLFENLQTGDKIEVSYSGEIALSFPGQMTVYGYKLLERGNIEDIPQEIYNLLAEMGWIAGTTAPTSESFVLTISAEVTTLPQGENFRVDVELKNNCEESHEIIFTFGFLPIIPGWRVFGDIVIDPPEPQSIFLEPGSAIRNLGFLGERSGTEKLLLGFDLEPGIHELSFSFNFSLISIGDDGEQTERQINVVSNTIMLTVQ